jgi:dienelactone hydrolase
MRRVVWVMALACLAWTPLQAAPPPISAYAALPSGGSAVLSPDGSAMAMIAPVGGKPAFVVVHFDGTPDKVFPAGDWVPRWIEWKSPTLLLAGLLNTSKNWNTGHVFATTRLLVLAADGSRMRPIDLSFAVGGAGTFTPNRADQVVSMLWNDPDHVLMATLSPDGPTVSRVDLPNGGIALEQDSRDGVRAWYADSHGVVRGAGKFRDDPSTDRLPVVEFRARTSAQDPWHTVLDERVTSALGVVFAGFDPNDPDRILLVVDGDHGNRVIRAYSIATGRAGEIVAEAAGQDVLPILRNQMLVGYRTVGRDVSYVYLRPDWQHDAQAIAKAIGGGTVEIAERSRDGRHVLACVHDGSAPLQYWLLDRSGSKTSLRLLVNSYEGIAGDQVAESRWVSYAARDGMKIPALLTLPPGHETASGLPFVVLPHGGPALHDEIGFDFLTQFIASRGYGVLQPEFRGSTGFGRALFDAGSRQWGGAMQDDITDGTKYLIAQHMADPSRIVIVGASFGGYAALEGVSREPGLYRGAVAWAPATDLPLLVGGAPSFSVPGNDLLMPAGDFKGLQAASPYRAADRIQVPVLLVHGERDFTVPVEQSRIMATALKREGKPVETIYVEGADHYLERASDRMALLTALDGFLAAHLR